MGPLLNDEQAMFADMVGRLLSDVVTFERRREILAQGPFSEVLLWDPLAELGAFGIFASEESGGFDGSLIAAGAFMEQLGRHLVLEPVAALAMAPTRLLERLGLADLLTLQLEGRERQALVDGGGLIDVETAIGRISGRIGLVEGAPAATAFLVLDERQDLWRVPAKSDGLEITEYRMVDGRVAGDLSFDGVTAERIAEDASACFAETMQALSIAEQWYQLGSMMSAELQTIEYVQQRKQFGRTLSGFQLVQARVAEMAVACEEGRAAALLAAAAFDGAGSADERVRAVAGGKLQMIRLCDTVASNAVQLHGGMGVSDELPIAAHYRQSVAFRYRHGTADSARHELAKAAIANGLFATSAVLGRAA